MAEPTIADVLNEIRTVRSDVGSLSSDVGTLRDEQASLRRVVLDEIAGLRHYIQGLDRDITTLVSRYVDGEEDE